MPVHEQGIAVPLGRGRRGPGFPTDWADFLSEEFTGDEQREAVWAGWVEHRLAHPLGPHAHAGPGFPKPPELPDIPDIPDIPDAPKPPSPPSPPKLPIPPIREFIKAAKRVSRANKKLIQFERGFIHEDGIKDREWYKHLCVAPGKW